MKRMVIATAAAFAASSAFAAGPFALTSAEVKHKGVIAEQQVYNGSGCTGGNVSPSLSWRNAPAGTKSFAITMYDPDAPTGSGWWHWVVFDIAPNVHAIPAGAGNPGSGKMPAGVVQSRTDFGKPGYGGPCPPRGDRPHRYILTVHALKVAKLDADENAPGAMIGFMINANQLGQATLQATYGRK